jgi:hypothetical protein
MYFVFNIFNTLYTKFARKVEGEFIVSCFLVYSVIFGLMNVWKAVFLVRPNFYIFCTLLPCIVGFYVFFLLFPSSYYSVVQMIFHDVFWNHKYSISFGAVCLQKYPYLFGLYISLSISSFHVIRQDPDTFWIYLLYVLCVCFRNFFLVPFLGYKFILQINKEKREILIGGGDAPNRETDTPLPLFCLHPYSKLKNSVVIFKVGLTGSINSNHHLYPQKKYHRLHSLRVFYGICRGMSNMKVREWWRLFETMENK